MMSAFRWVTLALSLNIAGSLFISVVAAHGDEPSTEKGDRLIAEYFRIETGKLSQDLIDDHTTLADWEADRESLRRELADMLGLHPTPARTPLRPVIVGSREHDDFRVERLHFQPTPGLYVAANFYLPLEVDQPLPTILYACGHARAIEGDTSYGNKTAYHHHGVWFARNGYACLVVDTIQWGEFLADHHGTYRLDQWWWINRGYTPAGVEAWTSIRALDYLETRQEVDAERFGVPGRSGGGIYSWWVAALDERIKVAVPVAGITTLQNYVVDGCVEGHCDCMFLANAYRWDYPKVAALVAPRPLLISNSDKDRLFPLEGVVEVHRQVRDVYRLYDAEDKLGLQITEGPHKDTQALRVHAFSWFNRFLKGDESPIRMVADKVLQPEELKVFDTLPADQTVTTIQETFVPKSQSKPTLEALRRRVFAGWPDDEEASLSTGAEFITQSRRDDIQISVYEFDSQAPYRLSVVELRNADVRPTKVRIEVLDQDGWDAVAPALATEVPEAFLGVAPDKAAWSGLARRITSAPNTSVVLFAPRGVGPTRWSHDTVENRHIRRRFYLLGQTDDGMRIYDVRRLITALEEVSISHDAQVELTGTGAPAQWALYAGLFVGGIDRLTLTDLPETHRDGITLLNIDRVGQFSEIVELARDRVPEMQVSNSTGDGAVGL